MPESAKWQYQKIIKPMVDLKTEHRVFVGTVITGCDDETGPIIENGFVEIDAGKIIAVGRAQDRADLTGDHVMTTNGSIMPGMFNSHAHLAWDGVHDLARQSIDDTPEISAYKAAGNMLKSLRAGVTTVRDLGMNKSGFVAKQAVSQGIFPGPRLLVCGEAIVQTGGHTFWCCREASGADDMRRAVREQVRGGADLIKIMASHDLIEFTDAELDAVIDEAHRNNLPLTAHATWDACINRVVRFGADVVEHGGTLSDETIQLLLDKKVPIVTTFAPVLQQSVPEIAREHDIPEWKIAQRLKQVNDRTRYDGLIKAAAAGVPIVFGTDAGSPAVGHEVVAPEMAFMVKIGVVPSNYAALRSATIVAARMNKLDHMLGTLEVGKTADVVVVDGNPVEDIFALERVTMTYVNGKRLF